MEIKDKKLFVLWILIVQCLFFIHITFAESTVENETRYIVKEGEGIMNYVSLGDTEAKVV